MLTQLITDQVRGEGQADNVIQTSQRIRAASLGFATCGVWSNSIEIEEIFFICILLRSRLAHTFAEDGSVRSANRDPVWSWNCWNLNWSAVIWINYFFLLFLLLLQKMFWETFTKFWKTYYLESSRKLRK